MQTLVGYTGFVGSNLNTQHNFQETYNSKNIEQSFGTKPDLCVYSGVRAEKFLANMNPENDMLVIKNAIENIKKINPKRLVLISTIDVFLNPNEVDEDSAVNPNGLHAYGHNRYCLEQWCQQHIDNCHIVRLPGLFGQNIKKNFIYDMIHVLPFMLNEAKFKELTTKEPLIFNYYMNQGNGFYKCDCKTEKEKEELMSIFEGVGFSALNFTDSRAMFQFYNLRYLWEHIQIAIQNNIKLLHLAVEPISANEIFSAVKGSEFVNEISQTIPHYDFRTKYDDLCNGSNGYIQNKQLVLRDIVKFIKEESNESFDI